MLKYNLPTAWQFREHRPPLLPTRASRVVTNDAWLTAKEDAILDQEANRSILGIEKIERLGENKLSR